MMVFYVIFCGSVFAEGTQESPVTTTSSSSRYLFEQNFVCNNITKIVGDDGWGGSYEYLPNVGFSAGKRVIYNGTIQLLDFIIPDSALAVLSKEELRVLRNSIYAKHGMIFQSNDLTNHFRQFSWYNPRSGNVENRLTDIDKENIKSIQVFENAVPNSKVTKRDLVGRYIEWFPVPSWSPELKINDNNTIQKSRWDNEDNWKGTYRIENGFFVVYVTEQGVSDYYSKLSNWQWPNGVTYSNNKITEYGTTYTESKVIFREPIKMIFPISDKIFLSGPYSDVSYRRIGSDSWFGF